MTAIERAIRADLGARAAEELASREKNYPAMVKAGQKTREEAVKDLAAWSAITALFRHGTAETRLSWGELEDAAERAAAKLEELHAARPADPALERRRAAVDAMLNRIRAHRQLAEGGLMPLGQGREAA